MFFTIHLWKKKKSFEINVGLNKKFIFEYPHDFQITNQMITACKSYITVQGSETIWTQETDEVIRKLKDCLRLNEEYQRHFHKTKQKLEEMPNERKFEFSEMYIFGKFDTFARRLRKIIDMYETMEMYSHLQESKVEGNFDSIIDIHVHCMY